MSYVPPPPERQCTAKSKQSKERCKKWAEPGLDVCRMHGGSTPRAKAAGQRNVQQAAARAAVQTYGLPVEIDPLDALLAELHRTAGHVAWLGTIVQGLDRSELRQRTMAGSVPSVWVALYQDERKHLAAVAASCLRAGVDERRIQLAERQGQLVAEAIRGILSDLGVDPATEQARTVVRRHLMAVASA